MGQIRRTKGWESKEIGGKSEPPEELSLTIRNTISSSRLLQERGISSIMSQAESIK